MLCFVLLSKNINHKIVENLPIINEIQHPKRGKKMYEMDGLGTRWMDLRMCKNKKLPTRVNNKGNINKSSTNPPKIIKEHIK
jgi:hypothetical protein